MIIDTHCHLDDCRYNEDLDEVLQRAKQSGIKKFIIPGADPRTLERAVEISEKFSSVYFAVGVHPYDASRYDRSYLERFVSHPKCVAIGECGLDYYRLPEEEEAIRAEKALQKEVFLDQIQWAKVLGKPLIVHVRESSIDCLEMLHTYAGEAGGVLHCYNADESLLALSKKNFYYGIGGVLTFKNARKLLNIFPEIPHERLLVETDAPYLTPHPFRGKKNEPSYCTLIVEKMCELNGMERSHMEETIASNTQRLFGI
ncbi:MAG: TatD family hydrolase [Sulfurovum sp.]|nr:TatD family hydrolase [Sulfurovum sp.]MCB4744642.1 TatD family hydrolase [Sulfurovum sp.]MCB4745809.1 TatD family hydrolase [Sulfurovum sp.]MCB4749107.1 TatD family hydrolase [Sulfurovum sp.]MCB4751012.1 TatD family hydrolase [Sulfurovum sp.]